MRNQDNSKTTIIIIIIASFFGIILILYSLGESVSPNLHPFVFVAVGTSGGGGGS
jgi:hypothetical protein